MHGNRVRRDGAVYLFTNLPPQIKMINKGNLKEQRQKLMGATQHSLGQNKVPPSSLVRDSGKLLTFNYINFERREKVVI